jgi:lipid-A-disaccharide synthase-like uncharacterized protein
MVKLQYRTHRFSTVFATLTGCMRPCDLGIRVLTQFSFFFWFGNVVLSGFVFWFLYLLGCLVLLFLIFFVYFFFSRDDVDFLAE